MPVVRLSPVLCAQLVNEGLAGRGDAGNSAARPSVRVSGSTGQNVYSVE